MRDKFFTGTSCIGGDTTDLMVRIGSVCVDVYEASVWSTASGGSQFGAAGDDYPCSDGGNDCTAIFARSIPGVTPSRFVTWFQAAAACANAGKRLLTNQEWQFAALGTPDGSPCNVSSGVNGLGLTGTTGCVSSRGAFDLVGNLSEWVADWLQTNTGNDLSDTASAPFGDDGIFGVDEADPEADRFPAALIRGGHFAFGQSSGVYALDARFGPSHSSERIGFRCAR